MIKHMLLTRPGVGPTVVGEWLDRTNRFFSFTRVQSIVVDYALNRITIIFKETGRVCYVEPGYSEFPNYSEVEKDMDALAAFVFAQKDK